jgi:hypothetical protein
MTPLISHAAVYADSDSDSFTFYKQRIESTLMDIESEFRLKNQVSGSSLSNIKNLVQEAYVRLPDTGEEAVKNEGLKK